MITKVLIKTMLPSETLQYIEDHPKWRLPTYKEALLIHGADDHFLINGDDDITVYDAKTKETYSGSHLFKRIVVLVPRMSFTKTATVFYMSRDNEFHPDKFYTKNDLFVKNLRSDLQEAMTMHDVVIFNV